jgi:hypothetical protein
MKASKRDPLSPEMFLAIGANRLLIPAKKRLPDPGT